MGANLQRRNSPEPREGSSGVTTSGRVKARPKAKAKARAKPKAKVKAKALDPAAAQQLGGIMLLMNVFIWAIGIISIFSNLGYDVTTIIAGLGIGGIAIALAAQNILGDLFNYFVIFFDRPFEIGDFIVIDDKKGNVEHIGIKTTRLKSLTGEQLIISNSDLTKSRIHNFKRMYERRIVFTLGVAYEAPLEQLKEIPEIIILKTRRNSVSVLPLNSIRFECLDEPTPILECAWKWVAERAYGKLSETERSHPESRFGLTAFRLRVLVFGGGRGS